MFFKRCLFMVLINGVYKRCLYMLLVCVFTYLLISVMLQFYKPVV